MEAALSIRSNHFAIPLFRPFALYLNCQLRIALFPDQIPLYYLFYTCLISYMREKNVFVLIKIAP